MFKNPVRSTPMTTPAANDYFAYKIYGDNYNGDVSFISTLRALLVNRIGEDYLQFRIVSGGVRKSDIDGHSPNSIISSALYNVSMCAENTIYLRMINGNEDDNKTVMKAIADNAKDNEIFEGWKKLDKVTALFAKAFDVLCYINPDNKSVLLVTANLSMRRYHLLQCCLLGTMPWYFDPANGISAEEMLIMKSFTESPKDADGKPTNDGNLQQYLDSLNTIAASLDFESKRLERLLYGIESKFEEREIDRVKNAIDDLQQKIASYNSRIGEYLREISDKNIRLLGLMASKEAKKEDSEILEYFKLNKHLYLNGVDGTRILFSAKDFLEYFDEEAAERAINNHGSFVYTYNAGNGISDEDIALLMRNVFVKQEIRIKFCAQYEIDLNGGVRAISHASFDDSVFNGYMPNPHINRYSCLGTYNQRLNELMCEGAYLEAIEQCIVSMKSLNLSDHCVMDSFMSTICGNIKCFELPDGSLKNTKEAISWLKERAKNDEQEKAEE